MSRFFRGQPVRGQRSLPFQRLSAPGYSGVDLLSDRGASAGPGLLDIDRSKFDHPRLYMVMTRLAGPLANLLLAGIAGSIVIDFECLRI